MNMVYISPNKVGETSVSHIQSFSVYSSKSYIFNITYNTQTVSDMPIKNAYQKGILNKEIVLVTLNNIQICPIKKIKIDNNMDEEGRIPV